MVLTHVSECRSICEQIGTRTSDPSDPSHSILYLYEFEARHQLGRHDAEAVLEHLNSQPATEPKVFEAVAGHFTHMLHLSHLFPQPSLSLLHSWLCDCLHLLPCPCPSLSPSPHISSPVSVPPSFHFPSTGHAGTSKGPWIGW